MDNCVADSSFYICWTDDMNKRICVHEFLSFYQFYIGKTILNEISSSHSSDSDFKSKITKVDYDYTVLFGPLIRGSLDKGEFEAIGIAKNLYEKGKLKHLILDDGPARNLLKRNFPELNGNQCGTVGFIRECYFDNNISQDKAINILEAMKKKIINNTNVQKRICSMTHKDHVNIIDPTIDEIKGASNGRI